MEDKQTKHFKIPAPIQLINRKTKKPYKTVNAAGTGEVDIPITTFYDWLNDYPLNDKRFAPMSGFHSVMSGGNIQVATKNVREGESACLDFEDWDRLKESITDPEQVAGPPMTPEMGRQYAPFMTAVLGASDKAVQEVKEETK